MQPTQQPKYYPNQFKTVNQNKICQDIDLNNSYDNDYQLLQGFNIIDVSVPPPNYHTNTQVNTDRPIIDTSQPDYAGVMTTGTNGPVPNQSKPKDNPPVKNTPPGVCNYCEKRGHGRQNCRLLKLREQEPHLTWCDRCYMKNHNSIHCTFQVPIHNSHRPKNFNKQPKLDHPQVKYVQYPPKLNSYENHKIRIFTNSKFHKREYHIKREITKRLSQLEPNLRTKVLNHYTSDNPKNNFIICPHSTVQNNHECYYCQNSHPELLKLEKSIASFNSSFVANNSVNNNTQQNLNPLPTNNQFEVLKNKVSLNINNKGAKVNKKSKYQDNKQNRNNHKQHDIAIKNEAPQKVLTEQKPNPIKQLENKFNPSWTQELDKQGEGQDIKMLTVVDRGHTLLRSVHNNNAFDGGDSTLINSLHTPYPHMFGILNKTRRIQVTNESFNTPTTVRNVTPNQFWVNVNNVFIYSLVDSGAEHSSIRQDIVEKLNLEMLPLNDDERKFSVDLAGKIPILGTVYARVNLTDVELNTHRFKVVPKISEDTDELVLGQDFLISKELIYCGDRRILRGYYDNDIIWTYKSEDSKITRILSNISCYSKSSLKVKPHSNIEVPVKVDLPSHLVDNETTYEIKNFSYATYLNLIRPLNTDDIPDDGSTKYQLRYYTSYPDNLYIVDLKEPVMELDNQSNKDLNYKENSLIGKAYNIFTIYTNRLNVEEEYKNKYLTIKDKGTYKVEPSVRECLIKANVEEGSANASTNCDVKVSVYNYNFNENLTTINNSNDTSRVVCDNDNYFQHNIKMTLDNNTVHNDNTIPDDP
ncbi:unnamed protein product, partial [Rotaria socialis]